MSEYSIHRESREFKCFLCGNIFETNTDPIIHYDENEKDVDDVSLCGRCSDLYQLRINKK